MHRLGLCLVLALAACGGEGSIALGVDLVTDLRVGAETDRFEVIIDDRIIEEFIPTTSLEQATRLTSARVAPGEHELRVRAWFGATVITEQHVLVRAETDRVVTVAMTRDCVSVRCDADDNACFNGACVDERCSLSNPEFCEDAECTSDDECASASTCGRSVCQEGACLLLDEGCGAGAYCAGVEGCLPYPALRDAGMDVADAGTIDASEDVGFNAGDGCDVPPFGCLAPTHYIEVGEGSVATSVTFSPFVRIGTSASTTELWLRMLEPNPEGTLFGNLGTDDNGVDVRFDGAGGLEYRINARSYTFDAGPLVDGEWHHLALTRNNITTEVCVFIDGASAGCQSGYTDRAISGFHYTFVGRGITGDDTALHFAFHTMRFWRVPLDESQVRTLRYRVTEAPEMLDGIVVDTDGALTTLRDNVIDAQLGWWETPTGNAPGRIVAF